MWNFFKRLFTRKQHIVVNAETTNLDGQSIISINDIAGIIRDTKKDFNKLTGILNTMQDVMENADPEVKPQYGHLLTHCLKARTVNYDIGIDIQNLERIIYERIPSVKDAKPTIWLDMEDPQYENPND